MAIRNLTLVENFICQHHDKIYELICKGLRDGNRSWLKWDIQTDKQQVMESIRIFFHLCLNASKIGEEHQEIEEWITALTKVACAQRSHGIVSSYKYRVLLSASDPITKFLFGCFDWHIFEYLPKNPNDKDSYDERILDSYDARLNYYKKHVSYQDSEYAKTANLLFGMKKKRNKLVHTAKNFYINRQKCLRELVYHLYYYIVAFHMIRTVGCEVANSAESEYLSVKIREDIKTLVNLPESTTNINITIECVDEESGLTLAEKGKDIRLFKVCGNSMDEIYPISGFPGKFEVSYFCKYVIRLMMDGQLSNSSDEMLVDQGFVDGMVVRVNIPPVGAPMPEKISLGEIILYSDKDLPDDVKFLLGEMERYADEKVFSHMARSLVLASATNNERDRKNYLEAVQHTREALATEIAEGMPHDINHFLQSKMEEILTKMALPYQNENFAALCDSIDDLYEELGIFTSIDNQGLSAVEQMGKNVADFLEGKRLSIGTKATDLVLRLQKELTKLEIILSMADKYPEVIEAEFGKNWLENRISSLYADQINYYLQYAIPFYKSIDQLCDYLKANSDKQTEDGQRTLSYVDLLHDFLNDQAENNIRLVKNCREVFFFWLDKCAGNDVRAIELKEKAKRELLELSEKREIRVSVTPISNQEYEELKTLLTKLQDYIATLRNRRDLYDQETDKTYQKVLARYKREHSLITRYIILSRPDKKRDILSEVRFESLSKMIDSCGPDNLLQIVCNSFHTNLKFDDLFNCDELGISPEGLYDEWMEAYNEWRKGNNEILAACIDIIHHIRKKYGKKKKRDDSDLIPHPVEVDNLKASRFLEHMKLHIQKSYSNQVPDFIRDILEASETLLPSHVKAQILINIQDPKLLQTENLLFIIDSILNYWYYSSMNARIFFLDKYISGVYGQRIMTAEAQDEFKRMSTESQRLFLKVLMNPLFLIRKNLGTRFILAHKMNFSKGEAGKSFIPEKEFYMMMSKFHLDRINLISLQEFLDACQVIELIANYVKCHPEDTETAAEATSQIEHFYGLCKDYFNRHVQHDEIEQEKRPIIELKLMSLVSHQKLKGKSLIEQLVTKYENLYNLKSAHKSGWYEAEKELFDEILSQLPQESPEVQEKMCYLLWTKILYRGCHYDIKAERFMSMKPFCSQNKYDEMLRSFFIYCGHNDSIIIISNPSVLKGLEKIRDLFAKYGKNLKNPFNESSSAFAEILIKIYKLLHPH